MATIKIKRGLEANRLSITPVEGELIYSTDTKKVFIGDGSTAGGISLNETASQLFTKLLTVDGASSGLDGDTLDGLDSSQLVRIDEDDFLDGELTIDDEFLNHTLIQFATGTTTTDLFIYDTTKDSDGGQWRKRTQDTTWYNETLNTTTRGSSKEFPELVIIGVEDNRITIFDATTTDFSMWMVFNGAGSFSGSSSPILGRLGGSIGKISKVKMLNGKLCVCGEYEPGNFVENFIIIDFISEKVDALNSGSRYYKAEPNISNRNNVTLWLIEALGNNALNGFSTLDVDMVVLDNAPIDPETNLPIPTIAISHNNGASIINDNGATANFSYTEFINNNGNHIQIDNDGLYYGTRTNSLNNNVYIARYQDFSKSISVNPDYVYTNFVAGTGSPIALYTSRNAVITDFIKKDNTLYIASNKNLAIIKENSDDLSKGMVNFITDDYQSGWMVGDIKGAFFSSTDTSDLTVTPELISNGTFDSNTANWTSNGVGNNTFSVVGNRLEIVRPPAEPVFNSGEPYQSFTTEINSNYILSIDAGSVAVSYKLAIIQDGSELGFGNITNQNEIYFTALSTTSYLHLSCDADGTTVSVDNISIRKADNDRSALNRGLFVNGTINRNIVATGSDLVGYTGFSSSNYLKQPYNSDLDFGTDDFYVMGWVKFSNNTHIGCVFTTEQSGGDYILIEQQINGDFRFQVDFTDTTGAEIVFAPSIGTDWKFFVARKSKAAMELFIDGQLEDGKILSADGTFNLTDEYSSSWGARVATTNPLDGSLSLCRIGNGYPTNDQITHIYNSEKQLFQENINCTLSFNGSFINEIAYDDFTNKLYIAGNGGTDEFNGIIRINSDTSTFTSIDANNKLIMKGI